MPFRPVFDSAFAFDITIAATVFAIVLGVLGFALVRYRARPGRTASQHTEHKMIETGYAVLLLGIAIAVVIVTRQHNAQDHLLNDAQTASTPSSDAVHIRITGFQWCWRFTYAAPAATVTGACEAGRPPTLVVPVGRPLDLQITATDVIHSFWVPAFRYKLDAFPGHINNASMTIDHPGEWTGHCAEFCGQLHADMTFYLKAVSQADYQRWIQTQHAHTSATAT